MRYRVYDLEHAQEWIEVIAGSVRSAARAFIDCPVEDMRSTTIDSGIYLVSHKKILTAEHIREVIKQLTKPVHEVPIVSSARTSVIVQELQ